MPLSMSEILLDIKIILAKNFYSFLSQNILNIVRVLLK